jgi:predicted RNase H-like HicB family nuclease
MELRKCPRVLSIPSSKQQGCEVKKTMIDLDYSLVIEATEDPTFFGFYSPELEGFSGVGHSIEDCLYQAKWAMKEHVSLLHERGLAVPERVKNPTVVIQNETTAARV